MRATNTAIPIRVLHVTGIAIFLVVVGACNNAPVKNSDDNHVSIIEPITDPRPITDNATVGSAVTSMGLPEGPISSGFISSPPTSYRANASGSKSPNQADLSNSGIWVSGQATIEIPADIAKVSIDVEVREESVTKARNIAATAMSKVVRAIEEKGVNQDDIVTTQFSIYPQTRWIEVSDSLGVHSEPRIVGYTVNNTVQVTVRDIDELGAVIDNAASTGGDLIRVNSIQFTVDDPSIFSRQIREEAAADAAARADLYARAMGVTLGQLVYLTELSGSVPMAMSYDTGMRSAPMMAEAFAPSPISGGDVIISVTVQAMFAIAD